MEVKVPRYRYGLREVNTYRYYRGVIFKMAQRRRSERIRQMPITGLTREKIEDLYEEERGRAGKHGAAMLKKCGPRTLIQVKP
jgi:hypothetical protein